jgi:hypothetical protein
MEPITCLRAAEDKARLLVGANRFSGGGTSELLLALCSFGTSQHPLASAECLKSVPNNANHGTDYTFRGYDCYRQLQCN